MMAAREWNGMIRTLAKGPSALRAGGAGPSHSFVFQPNGVMVFEREL